MAAVIAAGTSGYINHKILGVISNAIECIEPYDRRCRTCKSDFLHLSVHLKC